MNCYKIARKCAGCTQERWAEMLDCSVESVRNWEAGNWMPSDATAKLMAELSGYQIVELHHLRNKSELCREAIPDVSQRSLSEGVIALLLAMKKAQPQIDELLIIAEDNRVDEKEAAVFEQIVADLDGVIRAALAIKYAERGNESVCCTE